MRANSQKGSALAHVLIVLLVLSLLGGAFMAVSSAEFIQGTKSDKAVQAYHYARSGTELVIQKYRNDVQAAFASTPFYLYGSLAGGIQEGAGEYAGTQDNREIVAAVTKAQAGADYVITVVSKGNVQGVEKTITYTFRYTPPSPGGTDPLPPSGARDGGTADLIWTDIRGDFVRGNHTSAVPVFFLHPTGTTKLNGFEVDASAPALYFRDTPISLLVKKNMDLTLRADFLAFWDMIDAGEDDKKGGKAELLIYTRNSTLQGKDIPGLSGTTRYGVIYLGGSIKDMTLPAGPGYYYFPSGTDLFDQGNVNRLVKINDITLVDFGRLGTTIGGTGGGMSGGEYK